MSSTHDTSIARIERLRGERRSLAAIARRMRLDYDADEGCICLPGYVVSEEGVEVTYPHAESVSEACAAYAADCCPCDYGVTTESTAILVSVGQVVVRLDDDGEVVADVDSWTWDCRVIVLDPEEPVCEGSASGNHHWSSDQELVGGCDSNPGVFATGGCGIASTHVCTRCGMACVEQSASQGEDYLYDHDTVSYRAGEVSAGELAAYHDYERPDDLDGSSDLAREIEDTEAAQAEGA